MNEVPEGDRREIFELYKLHAELADRVSQRREGANRLYISVLTGFLVAITTLASLFTNAVLIWGGLLGMGICASWYVVIRSYRQLNTGKFVALDELENKLPYPFFRREWEILEEGKNFRKYWRLTVAETTLPLLFGVAYLGCVVYGWLSGDTVYY